MAQRPKPNTRALQQRIARNLYAARVAYTVSLSGQRLSQRVFADLLGITTTELSRYEHGQDPIPQAVLDRMMRTLGVTIEQLMETSIPGEEDAELERALTVRGALFREFVETMAGFDLDDCNRLMNTLRAAAKRLRGRRG